MRKFLAILVLIASSMVSELLHWERCNLCDGMRTCFHCSGKGVANSYRPFLNEDCRIDFDFSHPILINCPECGGSGKCPRCNGRVLIEK